MEKLENNLARKSRSMDNQPLEIEFDDNQADFNPNYNDHRLLPRLMNSEIVGQKEYNL